MSKSRTPKFRSAEHKRHYVENLRSWEKLKAKYGADKKTRFSSYELLSGTFTYPPGRDPRRFPSLDTGLGVAALKEPMRYTGNKIKGIAAMHKSNLVPVFSDEEAVNVSKMRRG